MGTIEGNKLIAGFMGVKFNTIDGFYYYGDLMYTIPVLHPNVWRLSAAELKYNTSWDWLMPVVEKINKWYDEAPKEYFERLMYMNIDPCAMLELRIHATLKKVWDGVIQFILWYNQQVKQ